jgi:hypothetical protein
MATSAQASLTETLPPGLPTALKRPEEKAIRAFRPWMIGNDTIGTLLERGWSLGICCRHCPRTIEMTPAALEQRFGTFRHLKLGRPFATARVRHGEGLRLEGHGAVSVESGASQGQAEGG